LRDEDGKGPFLPPLPYGQAYELAVHKTQLAVTESMSFAQAGAGVVDGDKIDVRQTATGGGPGWSELGHMLFWSAAAASIFLKSAAPVLVEFLPGRSSRSITVQQGEKKIVITGAEADKAIEIWQILEDSQSDGHNKIALERSDRLTTAITVTLSDSEATVRWKDDAA